MWRLMQILYIGLFPLTVLTTEKAWDYTILGTSANSSNEALFSWTSAVTRVRRGHYAFSGTMTVNVNIDYSFYTEVYVYFSSSGNNDYRLLPFSVPKQLTILFMANTYKSILMPSLATCSNAPQSVNNMPPVLGRGIYTFNNCFISNEFMPSHVESGFYKVLLIGSSPSVTFAFQLLAEVEPKHGH